MNPKILAPAFVLATSLALVGAGCASVSPRAATTSEGSNVEQTEQRAAPSTSASHESVKPSPSVAVSACTKTVNVTFAAANDALTAWTISMDGKRVATVTHDGESSISLWKTLPGVTYLALNPSGLGGYIPYAGRETLVAVDHCSGAVTKFTAPTGGMSLMALSDDGTRLASTALFEGGLGSEVHVYVWDTKSALAASTEATPVADWIIPDDWDFQGSFAFNADATKLAFATGDGPDNEHGAVYVLDVKTGIFTKQKENPSGLLYVYGWNVDGTVNFGTEAK